jgi:REP element-mobilizing transposase RayT
MCRGDRREAIFENDDDRRMFLATLAEGVKRTGWLVHGYVLMGNHYHLVIETPEANLARGMAWFQTTYTARFNARHRMSGHVFGGRYKAVVVDAKDPRYLATLLDYVHLNPVRAGLIRVRKGQRLLEYPWSSLCGYVRLRERASWLRVERGMESKGLDDTAKGRREMVEDLERRAVEEAAERAGLSMVEEQNLQSTLRRGWYYGREEFRECLLEKAKGVLESHSRKRKNYHGPEVREHGEARARELIEEGLRREGLRRGELTRLAKGDARKARIAAKVRAETMVPLQWLAGELRMGTASNIAQACRRHGFSAGEVKTL